jgi:hypothetical protein
MAAVDAQPPDDSSPVPPVSPTVTTLALPAIPGEVAAPARRADRRRPARTDYRPPLDSGAWPVGFSPSGDAPPDALSDVLVRGSHAVTSARRSEAQRAERAASIAVHIEAQIRAFVDMCTAAGLLPPITVRVVGDVPLEARVGRRGGPPQEIYALGVAAGAGAPPAGGQAGAPTGGPDNGRGAHRGRASGRRRLGTVRREQLRAWPVPSWRCQNFPSMGRSLHLFVVPGGRLFEGRDDPWPLASLGRDVRVWPVDALSVVEAMAEVDARRCALQVVHGMAHLLWRAGVGL